MDSAALELSIGKLFAQAGASLDLAMSNQQAAQEVFERKKDAASAQEFAVLRAALDQASAVLQLRTKEFQDIEQMHYAQLERENQENQRQARINRRAMLTSQIVELDEKIQKIQSLMRELPDQQHRLGQRRDLLLSELCQMQEIS
jgi:hypothetical protein